MAESHHPRLAATLRYLRIAFSVTCGIACVLLVGLWVRSYWAPDELRFGHSNQILDIDLKRGQLQFDLHTNPAPQFGGRGWNDLLIVPYWSVSLIAAALAVAPWIHWSKRFSLRTLLIATTLVAVGLGLGIWAAR